MGNFKELLRSKSKFELVIIFIVFAINGSLSAKIGLLILNFTGLYKENFNIILFYLLFSIIVTLIYPFLIIAIGFVFGQFDFFFNFSKNMLSKLGLGFVFNAKKNPD